MLSQCQSQFSIIHERRICNIKWSGASKTWSVQQNICIFQNEQQMIKHCFLVLSRCSTKVAQESAASNYHFTRGAVSRSRGRFSRGSSSLILSFTTTPAILISPCNAIHHDGNNIFVYFQYANKVWVLEKDMIVDQGPQQLPHQLFLLLGHLYWKQRSYSTQSNPHILNIFSSIRVDNVGIFCCLHKFSNCVILSKKKTKHFPDQIFIFNFSFTSPLDDCVYEHLPEFFLR